MSIDFSKRMSGGLLKRNQGARHGRSLARTRVPQNATRAPSIACVACTSSSSRSETTGPKPSAPPNRTYLTRNPSHRDGKPRQLPSSRGHERLPRRHGEVRVPLQG